MLKNPEFIGKFILYFIGIFFTIIWKFPGNARERADAGTNHKKVKYNSLIKKIEYQEITGKNFNLFFH